MNLVEKLGVEKAGVEKSIAGESGFEKLGVEELNCWESGVEKLGVEELNCWESGVETSNIEKLDVETVDVQRLNVSSYVVIIGLLVSVLGAAWCLRPYPDVILAKSVPIQGLTRAQRMNIQKAAATLDGTVIAPGARFSFNQVVGPRNERHGYLPAPAYVGVGTQSSLGGGVCLVSSIVYQLALESGLKIEQRTAHTKTIRTVPPGLDATVWYGLTDLAFTNTTSSPLRISTTTTSGNVIRLQLFGNRSSVPLWMIQRKQQSGSPGTVCVNVTRTNGDKQQLVSHDIYGLGHRPPSTIASRGGSNYAN